MSLLFNPPLPAKGVCCLCQHSLQDHIDETLGWRCHALGTDFYQCECFLRKKRYKNIQGYDLRKRIIQQEKETKKNGC